LGYEPNELPGCSTPLFEYTAINTEGQLLGRLSGGCSRAAKEECYGRI
jgi:hypothetical protein